MSIQDENKALVKRYVDAFNRGDLDGLCALFAPDAVVHGVLGWGPVSKVRTVWQALIESYRMQLQVESMVAEGDVVAVRYVERGTSTAPFLGGPPATGRSYEIVAMEWFEVEGGLIRRRWGARDSGAQLRQMGLPPA